MITKINHRSGECLAQAVAAAYTDHQTDYALEPIVLVDSEQNQIGAIQNGDSVVFCCRRGEREIQLTEAFTQPDFQQFERPFLNDLHFVILTLYHEKFRDLPVAFAPQALRATLGEIVSKAQLSQFRTAESEKFAHITFFLNGGSNQHFPGEMDVRIPSPHGTPFDQVPGLSLEQVKQEVLGALHKNYDLVITNFANGDVLGHTANCEAKIKCAEIVDTHLGEVVRAAEENDYLTLIIADHGNLEVMLNPDQTAHVAHTTNPVALIVVDPQAKAGLKVSDGRLADVAPTILHALQIDPPDEMTGSNLLPEAQWAQRRKVLLIILDGWGLGTQDSSNPIFLAATPTWDALLAQQPHANLAASGEAVGLQAGKAGNSEAGHMNIGAGRVVLQDDVRLDLALQDQSFYTNEILCAAIDQAMARGSALHLLGLLTEKSSHGSIDYPLALLRMAKADGLSNVFVHLIFDGRSTEPGSAPALIEKMAFQIQEIGVGQMVTGMGRGIALDRDGNYAKTRRAYEALVLG
jgi:2,3-bisphosphoglycerate-independent phosphoglycerate mutase